MLFNSIEFGIFLPIVFTLYWLLSNKKIVYQNILILVSSYIFYGWWDWRFLILIFFSSMVDFTIGWQLSKMKSKRWLLLVLSLVTNLGLLVYFKYYNFFVDNFVEAFRFFGYSLNYNTVKVVLPVGISFYTFQTLSYTIDVYNKKIEPTKNIISFLAFVSFFPQLVAGPIERAVNLLPQFYKKRVFSYANSVDGLKQILWGMFKKVVIADNCAVYVDMIFSDYTSYDGSTLLLGAVFFAFQIYGDFSGYSDIAIGVSKLFGFSLMRNFAFPYFSKNIAEFWRRWHISLTTWFRDYVYIPLGGSRTTSALRLRNTMIVFLVSGFWHGANWTFIVWGLLNALYFLPNLYWNKNKVDNPESNLQVLKDILSMLITFAFTTLAWIFFRSENIGAAMEYLSIIFSKSIFTIPQLLPLRLFLLLLLFLIIEWFGRKGMHALEQMPSNWKRGVRYSFYYGLVVCIYLFSKDHQEFIYFQF